MVEIPDEAVFARSELRPSIKLSPIMDADYERNREIASGSRADEVDWRNVQPCTHPHATVTGSGRAAIRLALQAIGLNGDDEVLVVTTGGSPYISGCVTTEIERICRWSQVSGPRTRCIFVIHSFGFRATIPPEVVALKLPVIEDCAYGFGSGLCGTVGDYVIYSFSKAFPVPIGGVLMSNAGAGVDADPTLSTGGQEYLRRVMPYYLDRRQAAFKKRRSNFEKLVVRFDDLGLKPFYLPADGDLPHAFVFRLPDEELAVRIRSVMDATGIESSVYYGSGGYYVPCHQNLGEAHIDYMVRWFDHAMRQSSAP